MKTKKILMLIMILLGLSLVISGISAADIPYTDHDETHSEYITKTESKSSEKFIGSKKINGTWYKTYQTPITTTEKCSFVGYKYYYQYDIYADKECDYNKKINNNDLRYVKYKSNEIVSTSKSNKYLKTSQKSNKIYKHYKVTTKTTYGNGNVKNTNKIVTKLYAYYKNMQKTVHAWEMSLKKNFNNKYIKITLSQKRYPNGVISKVYDPRSEKTYYNTRVSSPKVNFKAYPGSKITKVVIKSLSNPYGKTILKTIKNPKKTSWYMPGKYNNFWNFKVYYNAKVLVWNKKIMNKKFIHKYFLLHYFLLFLLLFGLLFRVC